ncbi:MAG: hypothetical protein V3U96_04390 [Paracoccaceae bacterium]
MLNKKRITRVIAIAVIAAGAGIIMQDGDAIAARFSPEPETINGALIAPPGTPGVKTSQLLPSFPAEALQPRDLQNPALGAPYRVAAVAYTFDSTLYNDLATPMLLPQSCNLDLTVSPIGSAMVRLQLVAPCYQNQRIEISHAGLEFADLTMPDGSYNVNIPALNAFASFAVTLDDGRSVEAKTLGLDLSGINRVAVSWAGPANLNVHALENGAHFGDAGHVWASAPENQGGGSLVKLGNPDIFLPVQAEVYTISSGGQTQEVSISIDASISPDTCGKSLVGRSFQLTSNGMFLSDRIMLTLPACGGENGYLVLSNLFQDLRTAQN